MRAHTGAWKGPGPDGVVNEVLQAGHEALHALMQLMWAAGHTPDAWKRSETVLLYKKNTPMDLTNYRRVGLENILYKLSLGYGRGWSHIRWWTACRLSCLQRALCFSFGTPKSAISFIMSA
jgi:hypothetical protein